MAENSHHLTNFQPFLAYFCSFFAPPTTFMRTLNSKCTSNLLIYMVRWFEVIQLLSWSHSRSGGVQKWPFLGSKQTMMLGCHIRPITHLKTGKWVKTHPKQWGKMCWTLLCPIQVPFQVQVGPKMGIFGVKKQPK